MLGYLRQEREAVDRALRVERDWKDVEEERKQKKQAFQQKDQRPLKKQNKNQKRPQEHKPLPIQPISAVLVTNNRPVCPKCWHTMADPDPVFRGRSGS
ncbi:hypothetical protein F511_28810 [Dorcoceras hygrometricum]|uniref:Uncharacterized protein n=1 Tax=Dorcoceras hygrometricum TaxID=472368 RepID=A0A2Z7DH03_9LAMI|nr:hypothetical protein F511_28810 [Dorcoceras hygrometricum]